MDWMPLLPLLGSLSWLSSNWQWIAGTGSLLALLAVAYRKGLLTTLNARVDSDRYRQLYKESVEREQQCRADRDSDAKYHADRDLHFRTQVTALQEDLQTVYAAYIASLRGHTPPEINPTPVIPSPIIPTSTPTTTTSPEILPTPDKRLFPSQKPS